MKSIVTQIAIEAGQLALKGANELADYPVQSKGHLDLVTQVDRDVEEFLFDKLRKHFPQDGLLGEEGGCQVSKSGRTWVIDPIDGTFNFVRGGEDWAISIGLIENGHPVFGVIYVPCRDDLYVGGIGIGATLNGQDLPAAGQADKSQLSIGVGFHPKTPVSSRTAVLTALWADLGATFRSCGAATISLMQVARGETDGYVGIGESSWDVAAASAILGALDFKSSIDWTQDLDDRKLKVVVGASAVFAELKVSTRPVTL
jgi:myo-inositol-1(or 4)-monophosphatase